MISCVYGKIMSVPEGCDVSYEISALIKHYIVGNFNYKSVEEFDFEDNEELEEKISDWLDAETTYVAEALTEYLVEMYGIPRNSSKGK